MRKMKVVEVKESKRVGDKCQECGSGNLVHDYDTGETVCGDCGLVLYGQMMDKGPEWRSFTTEEHSRTRVGVPTSYSVHDKGLSTAITGVDRDASGRKLPLSTRLQMWRLRKWQIHSRVHSSIDRNLAQAMSELDRLCGRLSISRNSPLRESASIIYRKALEKRLTRGRSINAMVPAAFYAACRGTGTQRTLQEIADASLVGKRDVARCYRLLLNKLKLQMPNPDAVDWVSKIAERTGISGKTQGLAIQILREARKKGLTAGKDPTGLAAAALYIACSQNDEKKTQKDIARAAGVTEVTVRNRYKGLKKELNLKLPD